MIFDGALVFLYINLDGEYFLIGGMRITKLSFTNKAIYSSSLSKHGWQELFDEAGSKSLNLRVVGAYSDSIAEQKIIELAFLNKTAKYKISFPNGKAIEGNFQIIHYERYGNIKEEEQYIIDFLSSGEISLLI